MDDSEAGQYGGVESKPKGRDAVPKYIARHRRHKAVVSLGACIAHPKVDLLTPDGVDLEVE